MAPNSPADPTFAPQALQKRASGLSGAPQAAHADLRVTGAAAPTVSPQDEQKRAFLDRLAPHFRQRAGVGAGSGTLGLWNDEADAPQLGQKRALGPSAA